MPVVEVACPGCGAKLKAPDNMAGKKAKCKKCAKTFRVPGAGSVDSVAEGPALSLVTTSPPPRPKKPAYDRTEAIPSLADDDRTGPMPSLPPLATPQAAKPVPKPAQEPLSLDDDEPSPKKGKSSSPLAFDAAQAKPADSPRPSKRSRRRDADDEPEDDGPRYRRSRKGESGKVIVFTGLLVVLALALGIAAGVVFMQSRQPEPPKEQK